MVYYDCSLLELLFLCLYTVGELFELFSGGVDDDEKKLMIELHHFLRLDIYCDALLDELYNYCT